MNKIKNAYKDHSLAVSLIVKEYEFINETIKPLIKDNLNKLFKKENVVKVGNKESNTYVVGKDDPKIAYLGIVLNIETEKFDECVVDSLVKIKNALMSWFELYDNRLYNTNGSQYYEFAFNYAEFKDSEMLKSMLGINKFGL